MIRLPKCTFSRVRYDGAGCQDEHEGQLRHRHTWDPCQGLELILSFEFFLVRLVGFFLRAELEKR